MFIRDLFTSDSIPLSFEFFPPKTEHAANKLFQEIRKLSTLSPSYVSVTYGASGSTRLLTHDLVAKISNQTPIPIVPHLTCIGITKKEVDAICKSYLKLGVKTLMVLRGDPPANASQKKSCRPTFPYAIDLINYIKQYFPQFGIGVAGFPEGHPECPNRLKELDYLKEKVDAGADYICTQLFFDNHDFYDFRDRCRLLGIHVPIVAGLMPITAMSSIQRLSQLAIGTRIPAKLLLSLKRVVEPNNLMNVGIHWTAEQVRDLLDNNVDGIHFYTLNSSKQVMAICNAIGIYNAKQLS